MPFRDFSLSLTRSASALDSILSLMWLLICVLVIIVLAYLFTKYVVGRRGGFWGAGGGNGQFKVLTRLSLGREQSLALVQAGERYLLLGVTPSGVSLVAELSREESQALYTPPSDQPAPPASGRRCAPYSSKGSRGEDGMPTDSLNSLININGDSVQVLEILFLTTMIALLPSMLVMMTSFARYIISLSFLRTAMGTNQTPPNVVLIGIAMFLTLITMNPVITRIETEAWQPYREQEIGAEEFIDRASGPLKQFMLNNTQPSTLRMYCNLAHVDIPEDNAGLDEVAMDLPLRIIIPSFMTQELQKAFYTGLLLYLPFLLIDVVVSSTLMSMGMVMLPPAMISTPFKLLLFVSVNGWNLMFSSLVQSVN